MPICSNFFYLFYFMSIDIRFPKGKYLPQPFSQKQKEEWLLDIKFLPSELELAIQNLDEQQLHTPYREGGGPYTNWCIMLPTAT